MNSDASCANVVRRSTEDSTPTASGRRAMNSRSLAEPEGRSREAFRDGGSGCVDDPAAVRQQPPTPPGSPVDRPFPAAMLPPPPGKDGSRPKRQEGDGARRTGKASGKGSTKQMTRTVADAADLPPRQPSDGYQALDDIKNEEQEATVSREDHYRQHRLSNSSDSDESSSECDWSADAADSSEENSGDEVKPPPRAAADGMSSDAETECLL